MCDQDSLADMVTVLSRRRLGAALLGAGVGAWLLSTSDAQAAGLVETEVRIPTHDGVCDAFFVHPGAGRHPAVLMWTDWRGLRPAFRAMARRLAAAGYAVLVPNPFYRIRPAPVLPESASVAEESTRQTLMSLMQSLTPTIQQDDATTFLHWLDGQAAVDRHRPVGTLGYCMGGAIALRTAAAVPARVGAAASFHGAALVGDSADSPNRLAGVIRASVLIAIAANDAEREPNAEQTLREAFAAAGRPAEIEVYAGSQHGWCPPDSPVYDEALAERAYGRLLALFGGALK